MKALLTMLGLCLATARHAQDMHMHIHMHGGMATAPAAARSAPPPFVASSDRPFARLMDDAMATMEAGMQAAPTNGDPGHDFVTMMLPHHQGAIDMAKAILLNNQDPELRNLALGIIAEQQNEINVMHAWLARHHDTKEKK